MKRWCWFLGLASVALGLSAPALASPSEESEDAGDVPGAEVTAPATLRVSTTRLAGQIAGADAAGGARGAPAMQARAGARSATSGAAAGDAMAAPRTWGLWASGGYVDYDDDFAPTAFDAELNTILGGVDIAYTGNVVLGIAGGWEDTEIDTRFNAGRADVDGYTVAPYLAAILTDNVSADVTVGFSWLETRQRRIDGTGALATSSFDSNRWFLAGNVAGTWQSRSWITVLRAGLLYAQDDQDAYTESNGNRIGSREVELGQLAAGGEVGYSFGVLEPFVGATYRYDFTRDEVVLAAGPQPENDRDEIQFVAGLRYFYRAVAASLVYDAVFAREDFGSDGLNLTVRAEF